MALNIFTDASIIKTIYGETVGCSGAVCMEDTNLCKFEITRDSTNNIAEITAVKAGIQLALEEGLEEINLFSDSQWSIFGLTKWMKSWVNNSVDHILMNSSGERTKNQHLFLSIMRLIIDNNLRVNFYHVKGHVQEERIASIDKAISVFYKSNHVRISREQMYYYAHMNNYIDNATRDLLQGMEDLSPVKLTRGVINPIISNYDLIRYYNLIRLGGKVL